MTTNWPNLCISMRNQGRGRGGGWLAHQRLGFNYRLSDINCALGIVQLSRLEEFIEKRANVARMYQQLLADDDRLIVPKAPANSRMSWFVFVPRLADHYTMDQRNTLLKMMLDRGIQVSNYFPPVHLQPFIAEQFGCKPGDMPVTDAICKGTFALPFHNNLSANDVELVCTELKSCLDEIDKQ